MADPAGVVPLEHYRPACAAQSTVCSLLGCCRGGVWPLDCGCPTPPLAQSQQAPALEDLAPQQRAVLRRGGLVLAAALPEGERWSHGVLADSTTPSPLGRQ